MDTPLKLGITFGLLWQILEETNYRDAENVKDAQTRNHLQDARATKKDATGTKLTFMIFLKLYLKTLMNGTGSTTLILGENTIQQTIIQWSNILY